MGVEGRMASGEAPYTVTPPFSASSVPGAAGGYSHPSDEHQVRLRLALDAAAIGVWEYDVSSQSLSWDARVREVAEVDPDVQPTWAGEFLPAVHPEDRDAVAEAFTRLIQAGDGANLALTCRIVGRRTGQVIWSSLEGRCIAISEGLKVIGTARDVTLERAAMERLQETNEQLEQRVARIVAERQIWADMFQSVDDPIAAVDQDMRFIAMNTAYAAAFQRLFGKPPKIGAHLADCLAHLPSAQAAAVAVWRRALAGEVFEVPRAREAGPDGDYYEIKFRPLRDRRGALIGAFQHSRDVSERVQASERLKQAQDLLNRAQKMEALGQLTGGVAHDFNNLLQVIGGNLQLLRTEVAGNPRAEKRMENALAGVLRGAKLASQLLAFGRRQPLQPKVVNLGRFLNGMDDMLRRALGEEVELETVVSGGLWNTLVDPNQIENAVLNLAINARDAMKGRGRLTLEAGNAFLAEDYVRQHPDVVAGQYVMIAVTDTGAGIAPDILDRVFDPFFSTKPDGMGTGLGLSMVHGLVKQSGGHIKIYSELGEGTTVKLYLPRATQAEEAWSEEPSIAVAGGTETILVVEDDSDVRDTAVALLGELGYRVLKASDAVSALAVIESGVPIDLLFTDVVMPGSLRSPELARRAKALLPSLAVLFTSGYTENAIVHGGRLDPGVELLPKPYGREALARKIRHVLANSQQRPSAARPLVQTASCLPEGATGRTILLVEDDDEIRASTAEMLRSLGHTVMQAADAGAALAALQRDAIEILVADRGLPDSSGDSFAQQALGLFPGLRVIFATGESVGVPDAAVQDAIYLIKPYGLADLGRAIDQALAQPVARKANAEGTA